MASEKSFTTPIQTRSALLAKWLKVSTEWLRYGEGDKHPPKGVQAKEPDPARYEDRLVALPDDFSRLSPRHKQMICDLVEALLATKK